MPVTPTNSAPSNLPVPTPGSHQVRSVQVTRRGIELSLDGRTFLLDTVQAEDLYFRLQEELGL